MTFLTKKRGNSGFTQHHKNGAGFTLIELLVVIAIIGVLASIVLASLNTARKKSRDTRRVADMNQSRLALELYYDTQRRYPSTAATEGTALLVPTYIASWPTDPIDPTGPTAYRYYAGIANQPDNAAVNGCTAAGTLCQLFHVGATVEDPAITAMSSRAGGCPLTTTAAGCKISLDDTTIVSATNLTCANSGTPSGRGCYDVIP